MFTPVRREIKNSVIVRRDKKNLRTTGLEHRPGFYYENAAASDCWFVSLHDVGVTLV